MTEFLLFLMVVALGVALRRAFVRIDELDRRGESLRERIASMERTPAALTPKAALPVQTERPPEPDLPPEGGSHQISPSESRGFRLQPEETPLAASRGFRLQPEERLAPILEEPESLETQIGTQWLLYIGVIAIVIGVAYFEKLAIDNQWIGETARVIQGAVLGLVLTYAGLRFVRAGYALYGQMITGGGAAILYLSTYAAFNFYHLIDRPVAFGLMIAITVMVAWLADRQQSQGLALFAVGGGFGTPFLLPATTDAQLALFGYDAILIGGTVLLSRRRNWPVLNIVSYVFTLLTVAAWADRFYTREKFLATELFITLFCAMFLYILRECYRLGQAGGKVSALILGTAPAVYYLASIAILMDHPTAMLVWLVAVMLAGGILSTQIATVVGLGIWAAVTLPLLVWIELHLGPAWLVPGLATVGGVYAIALTSQLYCAFERDELGIADILWLHANGLLMFAAAYFLIDAGHTARTGAVAAAFGLWQWGLAAGIVKRRRDHAIHFVALGFTLFSIAIALQFDGPAITIAWAVEGAVIIALGLRERRDWLRVGGAVLFAIAVARALTLLSVDAPVGHVVFLNWRAGAALVVIALSYILAWLHYREPDAPDRDLGIGTGLITAQVVALALLTSEINAYWALREWSFERQLVTSVTWGVYATVLIIIGLRRGYAPIRYFAILVFTATIVKVFAVDMAELDRIYRVASVIGLGILLLVTSYLYSQSRRAERAIDDQNGRG
jgi:uncharacterized membrane protein